jgi:hypothetical protein
MAYFALVEEGKVARIHVVADAALLDESGEPKEQQGRDLLESLHAIPASSWVQCSLEGEFRGPVFGIGFDWREDLDAFVPPKPEPTDDVADWVLDEETFTWVEVEDEAV